MIGELRDLLALQEIDQELHRLAAEVKRFEPVISGVQKDRERRAQLRKKREQEIAAKATERRALEKQLQDLESKLPKLEKQQEQVRTAREAEALGHEIETLKQSISTLEEQILENMDAEESLKKKHVETNTREARLEEEASEEETRLTTLRRERIELAKSLHGDRQAAYNKLGELQEDYDWVFRKFGPTVVVPLDNGGCSGCGSVLVPHLALNIIQEKELGRCTSCRRFLRKPGTNS